MDTELFFDTAEKDPVVADSIKNNLCANCPVQDMCLLDGIQNKEYGIWGGEWLKNGQIESLGV